jgi:hypothetical protein
MINLKQYIWSSVIDKGMKRIEERKRVGEG